MKLTLDVPAVSIYAPIIGLAVVVLIVAAVGIYLIINATKGMRLRADAKKLAEAARETKKSENGGTDD